MGVGNRSAHALLAAMLATAVACTTASPPRDAPAPEIARDCLDGVCIEIERGDDRDTFFARNLLFGPATLTLDFPVLENWSRSYYIILTYSIYTTSEDLSLQTQTIASQRPMAYRFMLSKT